MGVLTSLWSFKTVDISLLGTRGVPITVAAAPVKPAGLYCVVAGLGEIQSHHKMSVWHLWIQRCCPKLSKILGLIMIINA